MMRQGSEAGSIEREEREIVERVFRLGERRVTAVMTPRIDLEWLDLGESLEELRRRVAASAHGWFPVARERIDRVEGIVRGRDLWSPLVATAADIERVRRQPLFVPDTLAATSAAQRFRETRNHVAIVIDEFGGIQGLVTPTDILEALVGELPDEKDDEESMIVNRSDGSWSIDATTDLDEVKLRLEIDYLEGQKASYQTVGGYVADHLGLAPRIGASFETNGLRFEVIDTDGRRIDRIVMERLNG